MTPKVVEPTGGARGGGRPRIRVVIRSLVRDFAVRTPAVRAAATGLLREEGYPPATVSLVFLDDRAMAEIYRRFKGRRRTTDVLSFDLRGTREDRDGALRWAQDGGGREEGMRQEETAGEVIVSVDRARAQAAERGLPLAEEVARLVIHGLLHLSGYDHQRVGERRRMRAREDHWMRELSAGAGWLRAGGARRGR